MFATSVSVFLLYVTNSETFVVAMLCLFNAISTPSWNDTSLIIIELYPTHLRTTAAVLHLLMVRIGAIIGTNIFGLFVKVNPSIPILLVASFFFGWVSFFSRGTEDNKKNFIKMRRVQLMLMKPALH